jgi:hypothetical protein
MMRAVSQATARWREKNADASGGVRKKLGGKEDRVVYPHARMATSVPGASCQVPQCGGR